VQQPSIPAQPAPQLVRWLLLVELQSAQSLVVVAWLVGLAHPLSRLQHPQSLAMAERLVSLAVVVLPPYLVLLSLVSLGQFGSVRRFDQSLSNQRPRKPLVATG
jgi:hypothetical protein